MNPSAILNTIAVLEALDNTGQRYQNHRGLQGKVLLFVREFKQDLGIAAPYTCLGLADYLSLKV